MAHHSHGMAIDIIGINQPGNGRSCGEHAVCGSVLKEDIVVRIRSVQVLVDCSEETAFACFWVTHGIDWCHVRFLPGHYVNNCEDYEGQLAQVVLVHKDNYSNGTTTKNGCNSGCCQAIFIDIDKEESQVKHASGIIKNDENDSVADDEYDEDEEEQVIEDFFKQFPLGTYKVIIGQNDISVSKEESVDTAKKKSSGKE